MSIPIPNTVWKSTNQKGALHIVSIHHPHPSSVVLRPSSASPSHLCFHIMFFSLTDIPIVFHSFLGFFYRNLPIRLPHAPHCFPKKFPPHPPLYTPRPTAPHNTCPRTSLEYCFSKKNVPTLHASLPEKAIDTSAPMR